MPTKELVTPLITEEDDEELAVEINDKLTLSETNRSDINFDDNVKTWKEYYAGTSKATDDRIAQGRSGLMPPWPATAVDNLVARFMLTIFGKKPYFASEPLNKKSEQSSKINNDVLLWQQSRASFLWNIHRAIQSAATTGLGILKTGWDVEADNVLVENWDPLYFYYNPDCEDITKLRWCIFQSWHLKSDLQAQSDAFEETTGEPLYNNLDDLAAAALPGTRANQFTAKEKEELVEVWEYWDKDRRILIGNEVTVILKTENPTKVKNEPGFIPAIIIPLIPKLDGIMSTSEIEAIEDYVSELATIKNQRMDNVNLILNPVWIRNTNVEITNEDELHQLRPGLQIMVEADTTVDLTTVLKVLEMPHVTSESYVEGNEIKQDIKDRLSLFDYARGMQPTQRETASGITAIQQAGGTIIRYKLLLALRTGFTSLLSQMTRWNQKYLPKTTMLNVGANEAGITQYRTIKNTKVLEGDFQFKEMISALDAEASKEFKRGQLLEVLRIVGQIAPYLTQDQEKMNKFLSLILEQFDVPGLQEVFMGPEGGQAGQAGQGGSGLDALDNIRGAMMQEGMPRGASPQQPFTGRAQGGQRGAQVPQKVRIK